MINLPKFSVYGNYSSKNYGTNSLVFEFGNMAIWFSYNTPVAFGSPSGLVVRENDWGPTTGKHLNQIDGGNKSNRIPGKDFEARLSSLLSTCVA